MIADDILNYCVSLDTPDAAIMKDCNAFVKDVASHFNVTIPPDLDADGIVDALDDAAAGLRISVIVTACFG